MIANRNINDGLTVYAENFKRLASAAQCGRARMV
jgi:hypothetical protein